MPKHTHSFVQAGCRQAESGISRLENSKMLYPNTLYRGSKLEISFMVQLIEAGLPEPEREYKFHDKRQWRFDFAWVERLVAVEIEGGTFRRSRHTSGIGFHNDCEKYNQATRAGWQVYRFDSRMVTDGTAVNYITALMENERRDVP